MGNCYPEKNSVDRGEAEVDIGFQDEIVSLRPALRRLKRD